MTDFLPSVLTSNSGSLIGGILLVVYAGITSLRKRRDLSIAELEKRVVALEAEITEIKTEHAAEIVEIKAEKQNAESRADGYQEQMLVARRDVFALRTVVADAGLTDPTLH